MNSSRKFFVLRRAAATFALAASFGPVLAQELPDLAQLRQPGKEISLGIGVVSGDEQDRARFGMYNGLRKNDAYGLFGFGYNNRDAASGTWMSLEGRNLGLDNRELSYSYRQLGDMKFKADYSELVRHDPRTINTRLTGAGTTTPTVALLPTPGTGQSVNLDLKRQSISLSFDKYFGGNLQFEASFKNEEKDGSRLFGKGFACSQQWKDVGACSGTSAAAILLLPEPINSTIRQAEARLNYTSEKLTLSGGYYGSFYTNRNSTLTPTISGGLGNQNGGANAADAGLAAVLAQPMVLNPDNQAHQLSLGGNYKLTPHTRLNFKYVYTHATQNETFPVASGLASGRTNLGGVNDFTKAQVGFSSHLLPKLHLHGDLSFDSKKNRTPLDLYNTTYVCAAPGFVNGRNCVTAPGGAIPFPNVARFYTNGNMSPKKYDAKLEGTYRLPQNFTLTGRVKYEHEDFGEWTPTDVAGGVSGLKQKLNETSYRVELRRSVSETLTGAISFESSRRVGDSSWLQPNNFNNTGLTGVVERSDAAIFSRTAIFPFIYMDRKREKIRLTTNWQPADRLSFQLFWDSGNDTFSGPTEHGLRTTKMGNFSVDAAYDLSDAWKLHGYFSRGQQSRNSGHSTGYDADIKDTANSFGVGLTGKASDRLHVGADLSWLNDKLVYTQTLDALNTSATNTALIAGGGLPDVTYSLLRLKLYGAYALQKNAYVRMDYIHHRTTFNEWTYNFNGTPFLFSDNSTINAQQKQSVSFVGASYVYKFD